MSDLQNLNLPDILSDCVDTTSAKHREQIRRFADQAFAGHELSLEAEAETTQVWYCGNSNGSGIYHFYVAFVPHAIIVYGDIGDMLIRPGWNRGIGWLRGATFEGSAEYLGYMLSKVPGKHARKEFMPGDVMADLDDVAAEEDPYYTKRSQKALDEWARRAEWADSIEEAWHEAARELDEDPEWVYGFTEYDSEMFWCAYALCWFVRRWVRDYAEPGESDGPVRRADSDRKSSRAV